ncbi:IclR family transcriptional regulator C-terminal domain-containing protein [Streptomyces sp. NPDC127114]|uniref:IclR family transcriptional regulator domain-containing protein n=1 Tax=Streptomyces sp. NPDC127114 TaxID=3345366 RepID=UPI003637C1A4
MTDVSLNEGSGGRPALEGPAELLTLVTRLSGPPDYWDRPHGDFGPLTHLYELDAEQRSRANSMYRLGSKALLRRELATAADLLGEAASAGHPGGLFRLAVVVLRTSEEWRDEARFLLEEAARHGHGDARRLLDDTSDHPAGEAAGAPVEDPQFLDEIRQRLSSTHHPARSEAPRAQALTGPQPALPQKPGAEQERVDEGTLRPGLVLVPPPVLPTPHGPTPRVEDSPDLERPRLTALIGGLSLDVPDLQPPPAAATPTPGLGSSEPWWSASALRPAVLTDMARHSNTPAVVPARWQLTQRARDMLMLVHTSDGIDTRTLARRARMPLDVAARMLHWLANEGFVESRDTVHFPGPLMILATGHDPEQTLLQDTLGALRDELDAAVYVSTYTDGEITIRQSAFSTTAPPVDEWAPFRDTAHASAVGKSLLAQLDFSGRMNHLTRYPSVALTERTITSRRALIETLDAPGPHSAQFDLLEYSDSALCVAYSLGLPGRASSIALSLPATEHQRLVDAARTLSHRATGILLAHLLADDMHPATSPGAASESKTAGPPPAPAARSAAPGQAEPGGTDSASSVAVPSSVRAAAKLNGTTLPELSRRAG